MKKTSILLFFFLVISIVVYVSRQKNNDEEVVTQVDDSTTKEIVDKKSPQKNVPPAKDISVSEQPIITNRTANTVVQQAPQQRYKEQKIQQVEQSRQPSRLQNKGVENASPESRNTTYSTPDRIPVEQAALYFVPESQRAPGNLGGPPPLPSVVSTSGVGGTIVPPASPGENPVEPPVAAAALPDSSSSSSASPSSTEPVQNTNTLAPPPAFK